MQNVDFLMLEMIGNVENHQLFAVTGTVYFFPSVVESL
jgi:hypothetical protein